MLLIGRHDGNDPIARLHQRCIDQRIGPDRAMGDKHLVRAAVFIEPGDRLPQPRRALDRAIGQLHRQEIVEHRIRPSGQRQQLGHRQRFHACLGEIVAAVVFMPVHPYLDAERLDPHRHLPFAAAISIRPNKAFPASVESLAKHEVRHHLSSLTHPYLSGYGSKP